MSRGRGQSGSRGAASRRVGALPLNSTAEKRLMLFSSRLDLHAKQETGGGSGYRDLTDYWRSQGRGFLARLAVSTVTEALEVGDWQSAREITAEYDRRRGEAFRANAAHDAPDFQAQNGAIWAQMHRWLQKDPKAVKDLAPGEVLEREVVLDEEFLQMWPRRAQDRAQSLRAQGKREEARRDVWRASGSTMGALDISHDDLDLAKRAVRAAMARQAGSAPMEVVVKLSQGAFTRFVGEVRSESGFRQITGGVIGASETPYAVATLERRIDGRPVVLRAATDVSDHRQKTQNHPALRAAMAFTQVPSLIADFDVSDLEGVALSYVSVSPTQRKLGSMESLTGTQAFGPNCAHPRGRWERTGCQARLVCDDCFEGCLAHVPAHRLPADHALHQPLEADLLYRHELRYWDAVHGRPAGYSEAQTTPVSADPSDYRGGVSPTPPAPRITSVSQAMNRR